MKKLILLLFLLLINPFIFSQNLVQNGDFEDLSIEPCGLTLNSSDFDNSMLHWVVANLGSPDIFLTTIDQACWNFQTNSTYPGPIGLKGSQEPHSGDAFVGIFGYTIPDFDQRDYIQVQLSESMQEGSEYIVEFYVSLADSTELSIDNIGAYLSTNPIFVSNDGPMDFNPQVSFSSFVDDTDNWVRIADTIIAGGNYQYITIGNFNNDINTSTQINPEGGNCIGCYGAYYFIDDVSVTEYITTSVSVNSKPKFSLYPNPFNSIINIQSNKTLVNAKINIMDASGKIVDSQYLGEGDNFRVDLSSLSKGVYFIEIAHLNGVQTQRILKMNN